MIRLGRPHAQTLLVCIASLLVMLLLLDHVASTLAVVLVKAMGSSAISHFLVADAILSFAIMLAVFSLVPRCEKAYATFVVASCVVGLFLYWGIENEFFSKGLNPPHVPPGMKSTWQQTSSWRGFWPLY